MTVVKDIAIERARRWLEMYAATPQWDPEALTVEHGHYLERSCEVADWMSEYHFIFSGDPDPATRERAAWILEQLVGLDDYLSEQMRQIAGRASTH